ncbi:Xylan 1,4-beta-xylosidase precursor [compost metagenome]
MVTPLQGIKNKLGSNVEVLYVKNNADGKAATIAKKADVVIVIVGNHPVCNAGWADCPVPSEGKESVDRQSLTLEQEDLIKIAYQANPNTVVALISSFPYAINWTQEHIPAIVHLTQNSQELGTALAEVLFGDYNPAGRLTQTWVKEITDLPDLLDYNIRNGRTYMYFQGKPLYAFGHGLSYTSFAYLWSRIKLHQFCVQFDKD